MYMVNTNTNTQKLNNAINKLLELSSAVKRLTTEVKKGLATKTELKKAIKDLQIQQNYIKILSTESKVLSDWAYYDEINKPSYLLWAVIIIACAGYLLSGIVY